MKDCTFESHTADNIPPVSSLEQKPAPHWTVHTDEWKLSCICLLSLPVSTNTGPLGNTASQAQFHHKNNRGVLELLEVSNKRTNLIGLHNANMENRRALVSGIPWSTQSNINPRWQSGYRHLCCPKCVLRSRLLALKLDNVS